MKAIAAPMTRPARRADGGGSEAASGAFEGRRGTLEGGAFDGGRGAFDGGTFEGGAFDGGRYPAMIADARSGSRTVGAGSSIVRAGGDEG